MKALRVFAALFAVTILVCGCAAKGSPQVAAPVEEEGITQAEAQALWDGMATAFGGDEWGNRKSDIETATLAAFDVRALMDSAWAEDIGSRVLAVNPDVMKYNSGEGEFPGYMEANEELRRDVRAALSNANDADLIADAWTVSDTVEGEDAEYRVPNLPWQAFSVLTDAVMQPSIAATRVVGVEGTGTVLVTFKTNFTWSMDTDYDADWTNRYTVEKRDDRWVITAITNLGDYVVAVTESDLKRANEAADRTKVEPSDGEIADAFGKGSNVTWKGQDATGIWWASVMYDPDGLGDVYAACGYRDAPGKWVTSNAGAPDGAVQVDNQFPVPDEVIVAMKKADVIVNDVR